MTDYFVRHYLSLGPDAVHLFFDDPEFCDISKVFLSDPRLHIYVCDDNYWAGQCTEYPRESAVRAKNIESRQYANYMKVQRETDCTWLLNVDVDEIIYPRVSISELLASVPRNIFLLALKPFEAVYEAVPREDGVFDTRLFKSLIEPHEAAVSEIYGEELIPHKYGFWGHNIGKGFYRTEEPLRYLSCHFPKPVNRNLVEKFYTSDMDLLHFESMSFELFLEKRLRRITKKTYAKGISDLTKKRLLLFEKVYRELGEAGALQMYRDMNVFDGERMRIAKKDGFVVERDLAKGLPNALRGGEILFGPDGNLLVYDLATGFVKGVPPEVAGESPVVRLYREPGRSGRGYLSAQVDDGYRRFFADEKGRLVAYAGGDCQIFKVVSGRDHAVSILYAALAVTVNEDGSVLFLPENGGSRQVLVARCT